MTSQHLFAGEHLIYVIMQVNDITGWAMVWQYYIGEWRHGYEHLYYDNMQVNDAVGLSNCMTTLKSDADEQGKLRDVI